MRTDTKKQFDWTGSLEQLEDRIVMSADPLGGFLGGALEHHAIVDDIPAIEQHVESTPDFWIESRDQYSLDNDLRQIESALAEAHDQTGLNQVRADYGFTGIGQTVAVIDSGIAYDHFALGNGFGSNYRVVGGWDFTAEWDADPYDDGPSGSHGTHVAGIVGGDSGNDTGVAPGVDLVALRVFDDAGAGYFSWVENALDWIHTNRNSFENPITAVNLSLGVSGWNSETIPSWANLEDEFAQLEADGIFIAVSAGNSFSSYNETGLSYPAASSHVVPVMSTDDSGLLSYFSQRSSRAIAAPGRWITSTVPDYAGNNNGITDDYATYSGTSMASPYVAGASVIVREAMEFAGYTNINQDTIYNHMIATSDSFYDSATNQSYSRLNLEAAIDALMPADDFGSTEATAYDIGTVNGTMSMEGAITTLCDVDYFSFTAGATGTVTFEATNTTHNLAASWLVNDPQTLGTLVTGGNSVTVDVVAGEEYTVGFSTSEGLGYYDFDLASVASEIPEEPVAAVTVKTVVASNGLTYTLDSENWLSINGGRVWGNTHDFSVSDDLSVYWHSTNGELHRLSPQGAWAVLDSDATKFEVSDTGVAYSLNSNNVLSINGNSVWSYTGDFHIAEDQTIFWQSTGGNLQHRLSNGSWVTVDTDATKFAVRDNGMVYSLGADGWLNINGAAVWGNTHDFSLSDTQNLNWHSTRGELQQLSNANSWQSLDSGVVEVAVRHDGVTYSLTADGDVSMDGVLTWSSISGMYTDDDGYLVLEGSNSEDHREAGRFFLGTELVVQSSTVNEQSNQTGGEEVSSEALQGQAFFAQLQGKGNGIGANHSRLKFNESNLPLRGHYNQLFSQSLSKRNAFEAWEGSLLSSPTQHDSLADEVDLFADSVADVENALVDTEAMDSWFEKIGG